MSCQLRCSSLSGTVGQLLAAVLLTMLVFPHRSEAQQAPAQFGGAYTSLDARRQHFVEDWVARFNATTGQTVKAGPFYDDIVSLSTKTTFEAITNALMESKLTDASGAPLGDALALVERLETVHGQIAGARGDHQFRMYVRLTPTAVETLARSTQFKREGDNSVYHKGYPINYRGKGGTPSIQFSVALDKRRADIDVDYRSSGMPVGLFNGHLSASNSDVRAGNNFDRHTGRWTGFHDWWRGFFGVRLNSSGEAVENRSPLALPSEPRAGKKKIDVMANDFLTAWLVEGDIVAAMGYVSNRSYGCLAAAGETPTDVDRGMAPYRLMLNLKAAHEAIGPAASLQGLTVGVRLPMQALRVVEQPHHAQFVVYSVPDDVAAAFDCENRLGDGVAPPAPRSYGHYYGTTFHTRGHGNDVVALLWAQDNGYWKIVSWNTGLQTTDTAVPALPAGAARPSTTGGSADPTLVSAAHDFLDQWLIKKNYDAAFAYLSKKSYACYDLVRNSDDPAATSAADAAQRIRTAMERTAIAAGTNRTLETMIEAVPPFHPAVRLLGHPYARTFALTSLPASIAAAADCESRAKGESFNGVSDTAYGTAFGMNLRFRSTTGDDTAVLRLLWLKEDGTWRIASYDVEQP